MQSRLWSRQTQGTAELRLTLVTEGPSVGRGRPEEPGCGAQPRLRCCGDCALPQGPFSAFMGVAWHTRRGLSQGDDLVGEEGRIWGDGGKSVSPAPVRGRGHACVQTPFARKARAQLSVLHTWAQRRLFKKNFLLLKFYFDMIHKQIYKAKFPVLTV